MKENLLIIGGGGHAAVVAEAALSTNKFSLLGFLDDNKPVGEKVIFDYEILGMIDFIKKIKQPFSILIAIGNNEIRKAYFEEFNKDFSLATVCHANASISPSSNIDVGTVVLAGAVINANAMIKKNCIINSLALVDHDVQVDSHTHVERASIICAYSKVATLTTTTLGKTYAPFSEIKA